MTTAWQSEVALRMEAERGAKREAEAKLALLADMLPEPARAKLKAFRAERDRLRAEWGRLQEESLDGFKTPVEQGRASDKSKRARERSDRYGSLVKALEGWIGEKARIGNAITLHTGAAPERAKGETAAQAVERVRTQRSALLAERVVVQRGPRTAAEVRRRIAFHIDALAHYGEPKLDGLFQVDGNGSIGWPQTVTSGVDVIATLAWWDRDRLVERLSALADAQADPAALAEADRPARVAQIDAALLETERAEEHFIVAAAAEGVEIQRRDDADLRAVFGLGD